MHKKKLFKKWKCELIKNEYDLILEYFIINQNFEVEFATFKLKYLPQLYDKSESYKKTWSVLVKTECLFTVVVLNLLLL